MKTFAEFRNSSTIASKPVYTRKVGEVAYDLAEDVFKPGIGINIICLPYLSSLYFTLPYGAQPKLPAARGSAGRIAPGGL